MTLRKLQNCPRCSEDELWLWRGGDRFEVACYQCGWKSGVITLATGEELHEVIAATVARAKERSNDGNHE